MARARIETLSTPLRRPFVTSLGRRTRAVNVGLTLSLKGGAQGYFDATLGKVSFGGKKEEKK